MSLSRPFIVCVVIALISSLDDSTTVSIDKIIKHNAETFLFHCTMYNHRISVPLDVPGKKHPSTTIRNNGFTKVNNVFITTPAEENGMPAEKNESKCSFINTV
jgi:hypothetical protein